MINSLKVAALSAALPLAFSSAQAAVSLNFTLPDIPQTSGTAYEEILNYYNGGADQYGAIGPSDGITFGSASYALANYPLSNTGPGEPGGGNAMIFLNGSGDIMNVAAGFTTGFSSYYAAATLPGSVTVYSGLNGTGTVLATLILPVTGEGTPSGFNNWEPIGISFAGTAESVNFSGTENQIAFSDLTIGSVNPIINSTPDNTGLSIYAIAALGLAGAVWTSRKQATAKI
jgi:hypothetical protein